MFGCDLQKTKMFLDGSGFLGNSEAANTGLIFGGENFGFLQNAS
jgi:hypothetical protein